ncbi:signal peptidase II [Streptoalloteichus hindustanus]|uniref:Lipoprotein signal peptidase n=1 Tax=Streptoalloteichus hindustanus TaxID=2017 RepID=A0A1M5ASQ8_STRHI|nr:signal peptidase II [Streptoalloteichus hindustanus]SHF33269.1 signal peptidase II [Streptoalloteichus hindustanus]
MSSEDTRPDAAPEGSPPAVGDDGSARPLPPRRVALLVVVALTAFAFDLVTKIVVVARLEGEPPVELFGGGLYLVVLRNSGAAFSLATGMTWALTLVKLGVVAWIVWIAPRLRSAGWALGLGLVAGGALGNLVDRLFRAPGPLRGHVVDFLSLFAPDGSVWPVFNLADSAVVGGAACLVLMALLGREYDGSRTRDRDQARTDQEVTR